MNMGEPSVVYLWRLHRCGFKGDDGAKMTWAKGPDVQVGNGIPIYLDTLTDLLGQCLRLQERNSAMRHRPAAIDMAPATSPGDNPIIGAQNRGAEPAGPGDLMVFEMSVRSDHTGDLGVEAT